MVTHMAENQGILGGAAGAAAGQGGAGAQGRRCKTRDYLE